MTKGAGTSRGSDCGLTDYGQDHSQEPASERQDDRHAVDVARAEDSRPGCGDDGRVAIPGPQRPGHLSAAHGAGRPSGSGHSRRRQRVVEVDGSRVVPSVARVAGLRVERRRGRLRFRWPRATAPDVVMAGLSRHPASAW